MMIKYGWSTNTGVIREENQDYCYVCVNENAVYSAGIAVMCDGMGGMSDGLYASKTVCDLIEEWFNGQFAWSRSLKPLSIDNAGKALDNCLIEANKLLVKYGRERKIKVGTTASILLMLNGQYCIAHVGDSRVYKYTDCLVQITEDDSVAARKLRCAQISEEEYASSREQHILTQCVGTDNRLDIHHYIGIYSRSDVFFLCSDGMYHHLTKGDIESTLISQRREKANGITASIERLIDKVISNGETDNITGIIMCSI